MKEENKMAITVATVYIWTNLINRLTVGVAYYATQNNHTTYPSWRGLFAIFTANNRIRDGEFFFPKKL